MCINHGGIPYFVHKSQMDVRLKWVDMIARSWKEKESSTTSSGRPIKCQGSHHEPRIVGTPPHYLVLIPSGFRFRLHLALASEQNKPRGTGKKGGLILLLGLTVIIERGRKRYVPVPCQVPG